MVVIIGQLFTFDQRFVRNIGVQFSSLPFFFTFNVLQLDLQALLMFIALHHYMVLACSSLPIGKKLGHWVKLSSTIWFDYFLLNKIQISSRSKIFKCQR
jgi:hypothetical protein